MSKILVNYKTYRRLAHGVGVKMSLQSARTVLDYFLKQKFRHVILYTNLFECVWTSTKHVIKTQEFFQIFDKSVLKT